MADSQIEALLAERRTYEARGLTDRVEQVDAEIARLRRLATPQPEAATFAAPETTAAPSPRRRQKES